MTHQRGAAWMQHPFFSVWYPPAPEVCTGRTAARMRAAPEYPIENSIPRHESITWECCFYRIEIRPCLCEISCMLEFVSFLPARSVRVNQYSNSWGSLRRPERARRYVFVHRMPVLRQAMGPNQIVDSSFRWNVPKELMRLA